MSMKERLGELKESVIQYSDFVGLTYRTERDKAYEEIMARKKKRKEKKRKEDE